MSRAETAARDPRDGILERLRELGLARPHETPVIQPLSGGVSSDILRVELERGPVCVKRALAKLKVAADWRAPVARNAFEVAWLRVAADIVPPHVPRVLAHVPEAGFFVMEYCDPAVFVSWKGELMAGRADPGAAAAVGTVLGRVHAATADDAKLARRFDNDAIFHAIRLEPYLTASARVHPGVATALDTLLAETAHQRRVLIHGDVSPKNILLGPHGPVLLDAECACFGEPAFDLAFCLNHLLLKRAWHPPGGAGYRTCYDALGAAYLAHVSWEPRAAVEARAAHLLGGLLLARIDGKSPVEYLTVEPVRAAVRAAALNLLREPAVRLDEVWMRCEAHLPGADGHT